MIDSLDGRPVIISFSATLSDPLLERALVFEMLIQKACKLYEKRPQLLPRPHFTDAGGVKRVSGTVLEGVKATSHSY